MKILHVNAAFYPATYWGGPTYSLYSLCNALAKTPGVSLRVLTTDTAGPSRSESVEVSGFPMHYPGGYEVFFCHRWWGADFSLSMILRLWPMIKWADVVHLTAVYSSPTIPTLLICRLLDKPVVWSSRGALQRWDKTTKSLLKEGWEGVCNLLIKPGRCVLHVTSERETADSEARIPKAIAEFIPNGVHVPETLRARVWLPGGKLRLLYLGRLHPIKGIENLLQTLKLLEDETVSLVVCGEGDKSYSHSLRQLVSVLGLEQRVSFLGHVDGEEKIKAFMEADVCVIPSFSENFGMVVAEALAHGIPVITSKGSPWEEVENIGCGLWVENRPEVLVEAIRRIRTMDLANMGKRGINWMATSFRWSSVGDRMLDVYKGLLVQNK